MELEKKKIVLITTGQPALNPRIVKEADSFAAAGHDVVVLYCYFIEWANEKDRNILNHARWRFREVGGNPFTKKGLYLFTRCRFKASRIISRIMQGKFLSAERAQARAFDELLKGAKNIRADWYIGHNLGALAVAVEAAEFNSARAGFDFEDYHRGETDYAREISRMKFLEEKYLSRLSYYSTASELITKATRINHPNYGGKVITLLNSFPLWQQPSFLEKAAGDQTIKLFWFSQTIGLNRGLEILIEALQIPDDNRYHLTLAGRCDDGIRNYLTQAADAAKFSLSFAGIIEPGELPRFSSQFDAGMALELPAPPNRDICLTNKVFTYLLAGNAIIFSDTSMQTEFNAQYHVGRIFRYGDTADLRDCLASLSDHAKLRAQRLHNYQLAKNKLNWDMESEKLLAVLN